MRNLAREEAGQTIPAVLVGILLVMIVAALVVDFGLAELGRTRQADALAAAEEACLSPAVSVKVKNSDEPGRDMCEALAAQLRAAGYEGAIDAYFYEPAALEAGLGQDRRAFAFGATLTSETPTLFAHLAGVDMPSVATRAWTHAITYADVRTWKPASPSNGVLHVEAGAQAGTWQTVSGLDESKMPGVTAEVSAAVEEAKRK